MLAMRNVSVHLIKLLFMGELDLSVFLIPMMVMDSIGDLRGNASRTANFLFNCSVAGVFIVRLSVTNSNCSEKNNHWRYHSKGVHIQ